MAAVTPAQGTGRRTGRYLDVQMEAVAGLADRFGFSELRVAHEQNIVLTDILQRDLYELWQAARVYFLIFGRQITSLYSSIISLHINILILEFVKMGFRY